MVTGVFSISHLVLHAFFHAINQRQCVVGYPIPLSMRLPEAEGGSSSTFG